MNATTTTTTTTLNEKITTADNYNEKNMLITPSGEYNADIHAKLSRIINNIARNKNSTNPYCSVEDLEQDAWTRIFEVIKTGKENNKYFEINYLITVAKNTILRKCMKQSKYQSRFDELGCESYNLDVSDYEAYFIRDSIEFDIIKHQSLMSDKVDLKVALEQILSNLTDERTRLFIILKYIKEFDGDSGVILDLYNTYYESVSDEYKTMLDDLNDKCSNGAIFRAMGLRDTDNCTTKIRRKTYDIFKSLV